MPKQSLSSQLKKLLTAIGRTNKARLKRFEEAVRAHEMMGAQHPEDHAAIQAEYEAAYINVAQTIFALGNTEPKHAKGCGCHYCD